MLIIRVFFSSVLIFNCEVFSLLHNIPEDADGCEPDCDSAMYCMGKGNKGGPGTLLHDVQMSGILGNDGTVFLRKGLKYSEELILERYEAKKRKSRNNKLTKKQLLKFVVDNFEDDELPLGNLTDFKENPSILNKVNPFFRPWLSSLNHLWKNFTKRVPLQAENCTCDKETRHSYIYVPNKFVVAGGRFQEMYYWDSYWVIKGLLACEMYETARGIIENMIYLVEKYGFMPNGNRCYYLKRSQPPMLIQMANHYYQVTKNETFIEMNLKTFEKEFLWWYDNRRKYVSKNGRFYHLFHYNSVSCFPRPESYKDDYELLAKCTDVNAAKKIFTGVRTGAESGWDFSSRHMRKIENANKKNRHDGLRDMAPQQFAFVDLNSIIYSNVKLLAEWTKKFSKNKYAILYYELFANAMLDSIENVLWNEEEGIWLDYDLTNEKHRKFFFISNLFPLWSNTYDRTPEKVNRAIEYLKQKQMMNSNMSTKYFGLPTSNIVSKEQWDFPNVWPPLQSFVIQGLQKSNNKNAQKVAFNLAKAFVETAHYGFYNKHHAMHEKYNGEIKGEAGGNGEYESQTGFGWTNGFIFELFTMWNNLTISD